MLLALRVVGNILFWLVGYFSVNIWCFQWEGFLIGNAIAVVEVVQGCV